MILNKVEPYWTEEEREQLEALLDEQQHFANEFGRKRAAGEIPVNELTNEEEETFDRIDTEITQLETKVKNRYREDRKPKGLLEDVEEIVAAIEKEDFLESISYQNEQLKRLREAGVEEKLLAILKNHSADNYENCYSFVIFNLKNQLVGLKGKDFDKAYELVEKKVSQWYTPPRPTHLPIPYSKPTNVVAFMRKRDAVIDDINGNATIERFDVKLTITEFKHLKASLGISTDKLLSTALYLFARDNDYHHGSKTASKRQITIPLKEYARLAGYDVEEHETSTPEEAEAEKKRAKHALDNARRKVRKDLDTLYNFSFDWEEIQKDRKGKETLVSFKSVRLLSSKEYKRGNIIMTFTPEIADYLVNQGILTQYNTGMLKLDERKPNAYYIMRKLEEHYNMDSNQRNNRHDRIGIRTLLEVTDLPTYEYVQEHDRGHWLDRIKEPLEESLDYLTQENLLKSWEYTHAKGVPLTDEEAANITKYEDFSKLYLLFTPANQIDHTKRQERRDAEREKKKESRKAKQKKTTKA